MRNGMEERELLHTDGLSVGYHGKELIKEIGISLKMGEIVTLIGPNGAGKSTILKTIAKQLQEICGSVYVENTRLWICLQKNVVFPFITGRGSQKFQPKYWMEKRRIL